MAPKAQMCQSNCPLGDAAPAVYSKSGTIGSPEIPKLGVYTRGIHCDLNGSIRKTNLQ